MENDFLTQMIELTRGDAVLDLLQRGRGNQGCEALDYCEMVMFRFPGEVNNTNSRIATMDFGSVIFIFPSKVFACQGVMKGCFGNQSGSGELVYTQYSLFQAVELWQSSNV